MKILIDFPGKWEDVKNKIILKEKQINSNIYVIKAGSKVKIEKN
jgi:endonuclease I